MSAFMVRPEEEVTPWEGAAMVDSKALDSEDANQLLLIFQKVCIVIITWIFNFMMGVAQDF